MIQFTCPHLIYSQEFQYISAILLVLDTGGASAGQTRAMARPTKMKICLLNRALDFLTGHVGLVAAADAHCNPLSHGVYSSR
jgi:hypothetical protein